MIHSQIELNCSLNEYPSIFQKKLLELENLSDAQKKYAIMIMELLQTSPYEEICGIKFRIIEADLPRKIVFNEFKKFEPHTVLTIKTSPTQYLILSSSKDHPAKMIVEKLKESFGGKGGGSPLNAQILFDKEPNNLQEDIKHIISL